MTEIFTWLQAHMLLGTFYFFRNTALRYIEHMIDDIDIFILQDSTRCQTFTFFDIFLFYFTKTKECGCIKTTNIYIIVSS